MKKIACILLALVMLLSLIACGGTGGTSPKPAASGSPAASASAAPSAPAASSAAPASKTPASPSTTPAASASAAPTGSPASGSKEELVRSIVGKDVGIYPEFLSLVGGNTGYITDKVDYKARKTLHLAFVMSTSSAATQNLLNGFKAYGKYFNYDIQDASSNSDNDQYVNLLETYASKGINGFVLSPDNNVFERVAEVASETKIPYIFVLTPYMDKSGKNQVPCVGEDDYIDGTAVMNWLLDNYKKTLGDIDMNTVGVLGIEWSTVKPMVTRVKAASDVWNKRFPGREKQFRIIDTAAQKSPVSQEAAYNEVAAYVSAHPEIKYWLIPSSAGLYANGAARALESLKVDKNALICSIGIEELINQWNKGYNGCWAACVSIDPGIYCLPMIAGILALADGRAKPDTLWKERMNQGDKAAYYIMDATVITRDTYQDYAKACGIVKQRFTAA